LKTIECLAERTATHPEKFCPQTGQDPIGGNGGPSGGCGADGGAGGRTGGDTGGGCNAGWFVPVIAGELVAGLVT
jgi:hypothetical protein